MDAADQQLFLRAGVHYRFGKPVSIGEISARLKSPNALRPVELPTALAS